MTKFILSVIAAFALCTPATAQPNIPTTRQSAQQEQMLGQQQDQTARTAASRDHIREVQRALLRKGYDPGPVDGIFGPKTEGALRQFQEAKQLPVTGQLDDRSLAALKASETGVGREKSTGPKEIPTPTSPSTPQGPQETSAPSPSAPQETSIQGSPPSGGKSANQTMTSSQDSAANQPSTSNQKPAPEEPERSWLGSLWKWLWGR
jgi:hypothetical protein